MNAPASGALRFVRYTRSLFESARFASALSLAIVGTAFSTHAIRSVMGWPGLLGILCALCVLAGASFVAHRDAIEWHGLLPLPVLVFIFWSGASVLWSTYQWATLGSVAYQIAFAFLAIYLALVRDTIQVVRTVGDALRFLLTLSLALEILSGLLIDMPIAFLGIQGNLAHGGPIQGIFGTRNMLGLVAVIAFVTFLVEWRTRSVHRTKAAYSVALAALCLFLSSSPVVVIVLVVVLVATVALFGLRKVRDERTQLTWQILLGAAAVASAVIAYVYRARIIDALNAGNVLKVRYDVWMAIWNWIPGQRLQGWGWIGIWRHDLPPYIYINAETGMNNVNGLNAYLDSYLQVGLVGAVLFAILCALALGRAWLLASRKRSVIYVWAPLILVALLVTGLAESSPLVEVGWLLLVLCSVKAAQGMRWRSALPGHPPLETPGIGAPFTSGR